MKKMIATMALCLTLGSCATMPGGGTTGTIDVAAIIGYVKSACKFEPLASTILGLISQGITDYLQIGQIVCAAANQMATTSAVARRAPGTIVTVGRVGKVPIRGRYVR